MGLPGLTRRLSWDLSHPAVMAALPTWSPTAVLGARVFQATLGVHFAHSARQEDHYARDVRMFGSPLPSPTARLPSQWILPARRPVAVADDGDDDDKRKHANKVTLAT